MDFVSGYKGVVGLVFGNENSTSNEDSYVERLLDRIHNGTKAEDRRSAMVELLSVVGESHAAQLAFGAIGFPVIIGVLKEERDDVEMVRSALETLLSSLTPVNYARPAKIDVEPSKMNADILSREMDNISLLLGLLEEEDFYVRYYTLQVLTALLANSLSRLQEAILAIPRGITRLMDMMMDREVIRNEALLLLTHLTRDAEEIQKIVVFEGAFEKIFSIITEEGALDGGVVVQDCLQLLKNILRNTSNQTLLRETVGFDPLILLLKLRGASYSFSEQKTVNLLSALETIKMLISSSPQTETAKDNNGMTNKTVLAQNRVLDLLLMLGVENQWVPVAVRCAALHCTGELIAGHPKNLNELANKVLGDEFQEEPALNSIVRVVLRTSSLQEFVAADYVFKNFCEKNPDGQRMLGSTLTPPPDSMSHGPLEEDMNMPFGSMLLHGLTVGENDGDLEICARAASVLSYLLKDNIQCKEKALKIELEASMGIREPLMHRITKYLAFASSTSKSDGKSNGKSNAYVQQVILKLLIVWLVDCPSAVQCFLDARPHLAYLLELISNQSTTVCTRGLAAVLLGQCVLYNKCIETGKDAFAIVDAIGQKAGLSSYFAKFDEMQKSFLFSPERSTQQAKGFLSGVEDANSPSDDAFGGGDDPIVGVFLDAGFVGLVRDLEGKIRDRIVEVYSRPKAQVAVVPAELERRSGESDGEYINRLKSFVEKQCSEVQDLLARNAILAEDLARTGATPEQRTSGPTDRVQVDSLLRELQEASQQLEILKAEKSKLESEASTYRNLAAKVESDLKGLSDAYNSLEQANLKLEREAKALRGSGGGPDIEAIKEEAREEAMKESEAELNDLLVCLGQEQSKVERLTARLVELGEDVDKLLEGIGDDAGLPGDDDGDEDED